MIARPSAVWMLKSLTVKPSAVSTAPKTTATPVSYTHLDVYKRQGPDIRDHRGPMPEIRDHRVTRRPPGDFFVRKDKGPRAIPNAGRGQGGIKVTASNRPRENVRDHR